MRLILASAFALFAIVSAAWACPDPSQTGDRYSATGKALIYPFTLRVFMSGDADIERCPNVQPRTDRGAGFFTDYATFTFTLTEMERYSLEISAFGKCDTVLLIHTGTDSWYYDDDDNDDGQLDARISLSRPSNGTMNIWVGTKDGELCRGYLELMTFERR